MGSVAETWRVSIGITSSPIAPIGRNTMAAGPDRSLVDSGINTVGQPVLIEVERATQSSPTPWSDSFAGLSDRGLRVPLITVFDDITNEAGERRVREDSTSYRRFLCPASQAFPAVVRCLEDDCQGSKPGSGRRRSVSWWCGVRRR